MTALTLPRRLEEDTSLRSVPWRRMAWVTWRQHRVALAGVAAFLGVVAVYVWIVGLQLHHAYIAATACSPASPACADLITDFNNMNHVLIGGYVLQIVPALIGAFVGAPVLARELETGTFRYALSQRFGRWRWTLAKLVALGFSGGRCGRCHQRAVLLVLPAVLRHGLPLPFTFRGVPARSRPVRPPRRFVRRLDAGCLHDRRPGRFAHPPGRPRDRGHLAVYLGLALAAGNLLRQHYLAPLVTSTLNGAGSANGPGSAVVLSQWWTKGGKFEFHSWRDVPPNLIRACASPPTGGGKSAPVSLYQCFAQHGYTQLTNYQPASRFWPFQWIEGGWLLALSLLSSP